MPWCRGCCLPAQQPDPDPAPTAAAPPQGNPRNKIALKPGHSLLDWVRLGASGRDLTGVGGVQRDVSPQQLGQHCSPDDAWIAIRGRVYNVTHYLDFHPGGRDELMRGAGRDATDLFNQVHAWVNYESMLQKCVVGRLRRCSGGSEELRAALFASTRAKAKQADLPPPPPPPPPDLPAAPEPVAAGEAPAEAPHPPAREHRCSTSLFAPRFAWYQRHASLTLVWYGRCPWPQWPQTRVLLTEAEGEDGGEGGGWCKLDVSLSIPRPGAPASAPYARYRWRHTLHASVQWPPHVDVTRPGKLEMTFAKTQPAVWPRLSNTPECASARPDRGNSCEDDAPASLDFQPMQLESSHLLTRDIWMLALRPLRKELRLPGLARHLHIRAPIDGVEVTKRYTPVPACLPPALRPEGWAADTIYLMVKRYPEGVMSRALTDLQPGDQLWASEGRGDFDSRRLEGCDRLLLLGAGSGLTPLLDLVGWVLFAHTPLLACEARGDSCSGGCGVLRGCRSVRLVSFQRSEQDILWGPELNACAAESGGRFTFQQVLCQPSPDWRGPTGVLSVPLLRELRAGSCPGPGAEMGTAPCKKPSCIGSVFAEGATAEAAEIPDWDKVPATAFACACGPPPFLDSARDVLAEMNYSQEQIHCFYG